MTPRELVLGSDAEDVGCSMTCSVIHWMYVGRGVRPITHANLLLFQVIISLAQS